MSSDSYRARPTIKLVPGPGLSGGNHYLYRAVDKYARRSILCSAQIVATSQPETFLQGRRDLSPAVAD